MPVLSYACVKLSLWLFMPFSIILEDQEINNNNNNNNNIQHLYSAL